MEKHETYTFINTNRKYFIATNHKVRLSKDEKFRKFLTKNNISIPISNITESSIYDYLLNDFGKYCVCGTQNKFVNFDYGYTTFCSKGCLHKYRSNRMLGENNAYTKSSDSVKLEIARRVSEKIRSRIQDGTFTPCVTNSWARSKCEVIITRNNENLLVKCRSSWDAYFQIHNPELLYEKLRVPYFYKNEVHSYLIDFVDYPNRKMFEIKPAALTETSLNLVKFKAARDWASSNDFEFIVISDQWFKENYDISKVIDQPEADRIIRLLKQFKK